MDKSTFLKFYKGSVDAETCYVLVTDALKDLGIYTPDTLLGAVATVRIECGRAFKPILEYASGSAYEGRSDLGNTIKGDGIKYKGRGYIQLTGRANYDHYGKILGFDLVGNPDLALSPLLSAKILALYFKERKVDVACNKRDWKEVRHLVNGGYNNLADFLSVVSQYLA